MATETSFIMQPFSMNLKFCIRAFALAVLVSGCSEGAKTKANPGDFNPNAPPPGESHRKQVMEQGLYGAATIEELRTTYLKAHQAKDMQMVRHMFGFNVGILNRDHSRPLFSGATHPSELAIAKLFEIPIKDVEFLAGPGPNTKYGRRVAFYRIDPEIGKQSTRIAGNTYGRLVLVAEDDRRIDPFFVVLGHYGGRFVMDTDYYVVDDAREAHFQKRPPVWLPVPMDPQTDEEKALVKRILHH